MSRVLMVVVAVLTLVAAACGDDGNDASTTTTTTTTDASDTTSTTTTTPDPTADWERCENPEGFAISYPDGWSVNDGAVVSECSLFDPEPFTVPEGTDARVAAISAHVEPVAFHEAAAPGEEVDRAVTVVDGHQAVRLVESGSEFHGKDTAATRYFVDLSTGALAPGIDEQAQTLVIDTIELEGMDYAGNLEIVDRMVRSIELRDAQESETTVVARYGGGGTPFAVGAEIVDDQPCLTVPLEGEASTRCFSPPGPESIRAADMSADLLDVIAGVAGEGVFRVDVDLGSGTFSFLPVPIEGSSVRGWAMPVMADESTTVRFSAIDGTELGSRAVDAPS